MEQEKNEEKTPKTEEEAKEELHEKPQEKAPAQQEPVPKAKAEKKPVEKVKIANCANCNKTLMKGKWYYRDGKRYCNKRCWKSAKAKSASKKQ